MRATVDLVLLETAVAAAAGELLGLTWIRARSDQPPGGTFSRPEQTFLLVWFPPALLRLLLLAPETRPALHPELALPLAAPASLALAILVLLMPLAYWRKRHGTGRRGVFEAAGIAALAVAAIGVVASPFDASGLRDALADHRTACASLVRTREPLPRDDAQYLASFVETEVVEASAEATEMHSKRGLGPALARLVERRRVFGERVAPVAASLSARSSKRDGGGEVDARSPRPPAVAPATRREAGCAAVEAGMAAREVEKLLGSPDERISAEDVLGPRAERWAYAKLLCRIHLVDDVVEFVD